MKFSNDELQLLSNLLIEEAQRMDDDGNEGAFDASPLRPIYVKIREQLHKKA